jgi:uncharacterized protein YjbI with pentapeptide repeats
MLRADLRQSILLRDNFQQALLRDAQIENALLLDCNTSAADVPPAWLTNKGPA